jgi:hypothetical protein
MAQCTGRCISKSRTLASIKKNQNTPVEKKLESEEIQTRETKKHIYTEGVSENLMRQSPGKLKESRKILNDGKAVLLMVPWVRVGFRFIYLFTFYLRLS